jgi:hypothetical protein
VLPLLRRHRHHHLNVRRLRHRAPPTPFCLSPPSESIVGIDLALESSSCSSCKRHPYPKPRDQAASRYIWTGYVPIYLLADKRSVWVFCPSETWEPLEPLESRGAVTRLQS